MNIRDCRTMTVDLVAIETRIRNGEVVSFSQALWSMLIAVDGLKEAMNKKGILLRSNQDSDPDLDAWKVEEE